MNGHSPEQYDGINVKQQAQRIYEKYDPEENADQFLINSGATIIRSKITIADSAGRNRTLVRRNNIKKSSSFAVYRV